MREQDENVFQVIHDGYEQFTASEKKVSDYVLSHKTEVQYMSISELAEECDVAEATISRFCRRLKLKGYNDFKLALAQASARLERNGDSVRTGTEEVLEDQTVSLCRELYDSYILAMGQTLELLRPEKIRLSVDYIMAARKVYCMGQGGSMLLAQETAHLMSTISPCFFAVQDSHSQISAAALMDRHDVVLFFSYSGSTTEIVELIRLARERKAKVILITRFLRSPGAKIADIVLQCGSLEGPLQLGSVPAKMAQLFVVDALYHEMCRRNPKKTRMNRENIAKALADKHL